MRARRGVSLIEVMVALVLFGVIATFHTVATLRYGQRANLAALGAARAAAITQSIDLYSSMPRTAIASNTGCSTITTFPKFPHQRCVSTTALTATLTRVTIRIVPTNAALRPDTVLVDRVTTVNNPVFQ